MALHLYRIDAVGSLLDGETLTIDAVSRSAADVRAETCLRETFSLSGRKDMRVTHIAAFKSREAYRKAQASAYESGVALVGNDVDAVLDCLLGDELVDESRPCISREVNGCDARIQPGESADPDVAVCRDCYGAGRRTA